MLKFLEQLQGGRNLLGMSCGVDSTALYAQLKAKGIAFDVAIVDYNLRRQSKLEVDRAKNLCFWDKKRCFVQEVVCKELENGRIKGFENRARKLRYDFFESLIKTYHYTHLILAHQLDDALEWLLMQLSKGTSGEHLLMRGFYKRQGREVDYFLVRPLLSTSRREILEFLQKNQIFYFEDASNYNTTFKRNYFRKHFTAPLMAQFESGIAFSLEHFGLQKNHKTPRLFRVPHLEPFCIFLGGLEEIDSAAKLCGILLTRAQKLDLVRKLQSDRFSVILQGIAIEKCENRVFVCSYCPLNRAIPKAFKEKYRLLRIPKYFRTFLEKARSFGKDTEILAILESEDEKAFIDGSASSKRTHLF